MATNTLGTLLISVEANTKHLVDGFNRAEQKVNSATSSMKTGIKSLVGAYASLQAVDVAKFYATQIDALTSANNRLKLVTASQKEFNATQQELFQIAQNTRQSFTTTIELHARLGLATKDLSKSQKELLPITDTINKAMIISGGTAQAQAAALVQLGQAFSADFKAVGQELGSLREQAPRLYTALVDGMGVSREAFKKMAEDGSLSSEKIIAALQRQAFALNQEFATMTLTIEQSVTVAQNALQKFIGEFDKATGVSKAVSEGVRDVSTALDDLSPEQIEKLTTQIKFAGIAIAGTVATITAAKVAYSGYSSVVQKMNAYSDATSKLEMAKAKALNLSERASIAKALADEALNTKTAAGIALTDKQIAGLNNQAIHLDKAAKKAEFAAIQQSKYTKSLSLGATALRTFGSILTTIPITIAITALTSLATSFFNANKDAEVFNDTLSKTKDELNKLSKAQVAYNLTLGDQKLGEQLEERRKLALELKREQQGLFTGTALADKNAKPKENQETKRLQAELDAIDAGIKATRETVLNLKNLQDERKKALEVSAPKEDPEVERINKKYDALLKAEVEGSAKYQELLKQKSVEMQTYYYDPKADLAVAKKVIDPLGAKIDEINKKYDEYIAKIKDLGAKGKQAADEYNKARNIEINEARESANKKGDKEDDEELKKSRKRAQEQLKLIQEESDKKIKLQEDYENTILSISQKGSEDRLNGLAKEALEEYNHYDLLIEKYAEVDEAWETFSRMQLQAMDDIIAKQKELDEAHNNKAAIDSLDEIYGRYEKLIDAQIELAENGMNIDFDFGDGAKELNNISKAMQQLHVGSLKFAKQDIKLQEDFAKRFLEAKGDELKEKQIVAEFDADSAKLKEAQFSAEMAAYSGLAGAMVGAFEKGSAGAIAFTTLQSALGIASSWTAIANAWALPFPSNIPAVAMVASAVMPIISQLGGSGGSGGASSPTISGGMTAEQNIAINDLTYEPMTDRLDRQIELLESIDRQGSASALGVTNAQLTFEKDYKNLVQETLGSSTLVGKPGTGDIADWYRRAIPELEASLGFNFADYSGGTSFKVDTQSLAEGYNYLKLLSSEMSAVSSFMRDKDWKKSGLSAGAYGKLKQDETISAFQEILSEFTMSVVDSMNELKDAGEQFEGFYDSITGSMTYETKRLSEAYDDVARVSGGKSFSEFLEGEITAIDELSKFFTEEAFNVLMSQDKADMTAQLALLDELSAKTGITFENGAREALDYLESIELVAEAMTKSRENIKSFEDSFKTEQQLAEDMAKALGVTLATTNEELMSLFETLKDGNEGLSDSELSLLEANKALIESNAEVASSIRTLADIGLNASEKLKSLQDSKIDLSKIDPKIYTNNAGAFNAGAFNAEMSKLEAKKAVDIISYASENALMISDAMDVFSSAFASLPQNSVYNPANQQAYRNYAYALRDAVEGGNEIIGITNELNHALATRDMRNAYTSTAQGIASIKAASGALADVSSMGMFNGKYYLGKEAIAFQQTLASLDDSLSKGIITLEVYDKTLNYMDNNYGDLIDSGLTYQEALEKQQAAILAGQWDVYNASLRSINYYFGEIGRMSDTLASTAEEIAKPVNQITDAIGRLNSTTQVLEYSASSLTNTAGALGKKGTPKEAETATLIAESARILSSSLTTANAKAISEELAKNPAFADTMPDQLKQFAFMIEGVTAYNYQEIERAFMLMNDSLIDGNMTKEQYTALFNTSLDLYEGSFTSVLVDRWDDWVKSNESKDETLARLSTETGIATDYLNINIQAIEDAALANDNLSDSEYELLTLAKSIKETRDAEAKSIQDQIDILEGTVTQRELELAKIDPLNVALQERLWYLEDEKALVDTNNTLNERLQYTIYANNDATLTRLQRERELAEYTDESSKAILEQIYYYEDLNKSLEEANALLETSKNNIESFARGLMDADTTAQYLADSLGVSLATSVDGLSSLFNQFANDADGLTDAELELLEANKELVTSTEDLDKIVSDTVDSWGKLEGALESIQNVIDSLRGSSKTSEESLEDYYRAIAEAQRLSTTDLYDDYIAAVDEAIEKSSVLMDETNFETSRDMQFAQLVAANQFEALQDITMDEIDYLKQIEENTRNQIKALTDAVNALGGNILSAINAPEPKPGVIAAPSSTASSVSYVEGRGYDVVGGGTAYFDSESEFNSWLANGSIASFAVGTPNVPFDMLAQIHKGEMIPTATMSEGIRRGEVMLGDTSGIVDRMDKLISRIEALEETNSRHLARIEYNTTKSRTEGVA